MIDLLTAPAMATHPGFTTFAELIQSYGLRNTATALVISPRTVAARLANPGSFILTELVRLAELTETTLRHVVTKLAEAANAGTTEPGKEERPKGSVVLGSNELVIRMKNPDTMSKEDLALLARLSGSTVSTLTSQLAAQKAKKAGKPTTIAELIHGIGGRYETAEALGMAANTLATRMKKPKTFTLADLQAVAKATNTELGTVAELAQYQSENHIPPPPPQAGRPPLNH
jgi:hypothetical protein